MSFRRILQHLSKKAVHGKAEVTQLPSQSPPTENDINSWQRRDRKRRYRCFIGELQSQIVARVSCGSEVRLFPQDTGNALELYESGERRFFLQTDYMDRAGAGIWIAAISADPPGTGLGSTVMTSVCAAADQASLGVAIRSVPRQGGGGIADLRRRRACWLQRFGFVEKMDGDINFLRPAPPYPDIERQLEFFGYPVPDLREVPFEEFAGTGNTRHFGEFADNALSSFRNIAIDQYQTEDLSLFGIPQRYRMVLEKIHPLEDTRRATILLVDDEEDQKVIGGLGTRTLVIDPAHRKLGLSVPLILTRSALSHGIPNPHDSYTGEGRAAMFYSYLWMQNYYEKAGRQV